MSKRSLRCVLFSCRALPTRCSDNAWTHCVSSFIEILSTNVVSSVRIVAREVFRNAAWLDGDKLGIFASCGVRAVLDVEVSFGITSPYLTLILRSSSRGIGGITWLFLSRFPEKRPLIFSRTRRLFECDLGACSKVRACDSERHKTLRHTFEAATPSDFMRCLSGDNLRPRGDGSGILNAL